jgi:hypothetical protein
MKYLKKLRQWLPMDYLIQAYRDTRMVYATIRVVLSEFFATTFPCTTRHSVPDNLNNLFGRWVNVER